MGKWILLTIPLLFWLRLLLSQLNDNTIRGLTLEVILNICLVTLLLYFFIKRTSIRKFIDWLVLTGFSLYFCILFGETTWLSFYYIFNSEFIGFDPHRNFIFVNLIPFNGISETINNNSMALYQILGNLLMLSPFAFTSLYFEWTNNVKKTVVYLCFVSIGIEVFQLIETAFSSLFELGGSLRAADIDDVILNTSGALIGSIIFLVWKKVSIAFSNIKEKRGQFIDTN
jgi:glycopeptide antibiotics resistance protein